FQFEMCFAGPTCCGFPIKEASQIFAVVVCAASVLVFAFSLFQVVIYIIHGVVPWLMLIPLAWTLVQFVSFVFVFPACRGKQPQKMIPALGVSAFATLGLVGCLIWSLVLIIQQGYVNFFWYNWHIGWPVPVAAGIGALIFVYITITLFIAFKHIKLQRIEMARIAALPRYEQGDWRGVQ
ncbi:hypothetical protein PMAYCL1PPCAC_23029, partial [Pristionchus mayeri]